MNDCALLYVVYSDPIRSHEEAVYVVNNSRKSVSQLFLHLPFQPLLSSEWEAIGSLAWT